MEVKLETHIDGVWNTSRQNYLDCEIIIKSKDGKGIKAHVLENGKEIFTWRFNFIEPEKLVAKMKRKIDQMRSGEWTPIKLRNK